MIPKVIAELQLLEKNPDKVRMNSFFNKYIVELSQSAGGMNAGIAGVNEASDKVAKKLLKPVKKYREKIAEVFLMAQKSLKFSREQYLEVIYLK